jgi:hypothetical protein
MRSRFPRLPFFFLPLAAISLISVSSWAAAATPRDAGAPRASESAASNQFVAQAGAIVGPGLGATLALDARVVSGLFLGAQGGFFTDDHAGYPFVGARASYRIDVSDTFRVVPTLGVAHVRVLQMDIDDTGIAYQTPVSPTAGLQLAAQLGHFLVGCDFQIMPVHVKRSMLGPFETRFTEETLYPTPVALFVGATF